MRERAAIACDKYQKCGSRQPADYLPQAGEAHSHPGHHFRQRRITRILK